jgi:hypothetical protein
MEKRMNSHWSDPLVGPPGNAEVETFLKEYNEGKHPLPPEYATALEASRDDLMRRVREILRQRSNEALSGSAARSDAEIGGKS